MIRRVLENVSNIGYSVSFTTRAPREGEIDGTHYHFVGRKEFENLMTQGELLEYAEVHGNMYGTSLAQVNRETDTGRDVILEIDVQGAAWVKKRASDAISVFILPPSYEVLKTRLEGRATEDVEDLRLRLKNSRGEVEKYIEFDYVIINDEVEKASAELKAIILAERIKRRRQENVIQEVLKTFDNIQFD